MDAPPRKSQWNLATEIEPAVTVKALRAMMQKWIDGDVDVTDDWTRDLEALCDAAEEGHAVPARW